MKNYIKIVLFTFLITGIHTTFAGSITIKNELNESVTCSCAWQKDKNTKEQVRAGEIKNVEDKGAGDLIGFTATTKNPRKSKYGKNRYFVISKNAQGNKMVTAYIDANAYATRTQ